MVNALLNAGANKDAKDQVGDGVKGMVELPRGGPHGGGVHIPGIGP